MSTLHMINWCKILLNGISNFSFWENGSAFNYVAQLQISSYA